MKVRDLINQLLDMPMTADVQLHLDEEYCSFTVEHLTKGDHDAPAHLVALEPEPDPPHIAEINAKYQLVETEVLQLTVGALQCVAKLLPAGETHAVKFTGRWQGFAPRTIGEILDLANAALEPKAEG